MSTTIIENLFDEGTTIPGSPFFRMVGGVNQFTNKTSPIGASPYGAMFINPYGAAADTFGRFRVASPVNGFVNKQVYAKDTLFWNEQLTLAATSTFLSNQASVELQCTTTSGSEAIRQTKQYINYQSGRTQCMFITGIMGAIKANVRQRIGYFDANNGLFFQQDGTNLSVVRRTNVTSTPVDNAVLQSAWNVDKLDGTGKSGVTIDMSKQQVFVIDFSWQGAGNARMGFLLNGTIVYCHMFANPNSLTTVWMSTPTLPIRFEITNTGTAASNTSMRQTCACVISEGGDPVGCFASHNTGTTAKATTSNTANPIVSIRAKSTFNRATLLPLAASILTTSNCDLLIELYIGGTVTGGAYASASTAAEANTTGTAFSGGTRIFSQYNNATSNTAGGVINIIIPATNSLIATADIAGTTIEAINVVVTPIGNAANVYATLNWQEIY